MLRNVILAITKNARQLSVTIFLGAIIIFIFSILGFTFYASDFFNGDVVGEGENLCTSLLTCYLWTFT